jgi:hypothetical protein
VAYRAVAGAVLAAIDTDPERVREHTHWLSRALRWDGRGRERSLLLRGRDLRAAEDWIARQDADPSPVPLQAQFVAASRTAERRRLRSTVAATATALVLTVALAVAAVVQWQEAVSQRDQAQSRALAAAALSQLDVDPERSLLLARAAFASAPTEQAVVALRTSLDRSRVRLRVAAHPGGVTGVAWSPDGRTVISSGHDGTVAAWDASTGAPRGRLVLGPDTVRMEAATAAAVGVAVNGGRAARRLGRRLHRDAGATRRAGRIRGHRGDDQRRRSDRGCGNGRRDGAAVDIRRNGASDRAVGHVAGGSDRALR